MQGGCWTGSQRFGNIRKRYLEYPKGKSKNCFIHGPEHSSYESKVLGDFFFKYVKSRPTKDQNHDPVIRKEFNRQQENNDFSNIAVDGILPHKNKKVSDENKAPENIESKFDDNEFYLIDNMRLEYTKEKLEWRKRAFEWKLKNTYEIENQNDMTHLHENEVNKIS